MGLFGLFEKPGHALKKHSERAANKRAQAIDRWESLQFLIRAGTPEAVDGLLPRFTFYVDPSITDQEEKDAAFEGILRAGASAVPSVRAHMARSESLSWHLKILERLLEPTEVVGVLLELLQPLDTEYARDPLRKVQLVSALEERHDPRIATALARFLRDTNETVRFHAAGAILAQDDAEAFRGDLDACLRVEESVRVRNRLLDAYLQRGWSVGVEGDAPAHVSTSLFTVSERGQVKRV